MQQICQCRCRSRKQEITCKRQSTVSPALQKFKFLNMKLKSQTASTLSSSCSNQDCVTTQVNRYLADIRENDTRNPLASWKERQTSQAYCKIAPLQRIFCRLQPHRPLWKDFFEYIYIRFIINSNSRMTHRTQAHSYKLE